MVFSMWVDQFINSADLESYVIVVVVRLYDSALVAVEEGNLTGGGE